MNKTMLLAAAAATCLAAGPALAQDDMDWTGIYVGANAGGTWGDTRMQITASPGTSGVVIPPADIAQINSIDDDDNDSGWTGGVQAGFNYQSGSLVWGLETDFGFLDMEQGRSRTFQSAVLINPPISFTIEQQTNTDWLWTIRPRLGFAAGPLMLYGTGGLAVADVKLTTRYTDTRATPNLVEGDRSKTKTGWVGGLGGAYAFTPQISVRGEWLYVDLGDVRDSASGTFVTLTSESKVRGNLLRLGMDYKF